MTRSATVSVNTIITGSGEYFTKNIYISFLGILNSFINTSSDSASPNFNHFFLSVHFCETSFSSKKHFLSAKSTCGFLSTMLETVSQFELSIKICKSIFPGLGLEEFVKLQRFSFWYQSLDTSIYWY